MDKPIHLINAELPGLRRYACALAVDTTTAASLVDATVTSATKSWDHRGPDLRLWLYRILRNRAAERYVPKQWRSFAARGLEVRNAPLDQGLAELTPMQREIVVLVCAEGWSYDDVASLTSLPTGTILSSLMRARRCLRQMVAETEA